MTVAAMDQYSEIGLDSQCLSYVIDALEGLEEPTDALADQKVALVRLYLYTPGTLWVTPTVQTEFLRIKNAARRDTHRSWTSVLFGVRPLSNPASVALRADELMKTHDAPNDCRILAEAEDIRLATLLTFDDDFLARLATQGGRVKLVRPTQFWQSLGIPRGALPVKLPAHGNPLTHQRWWRW
jgi:predicted nucleic acid-binding protein